jgi:hypothetical protein
MLGTLATAVVYMLSLVAVFGIVSDHVLQKSTAPLQAVDGPRPAADATASATPRKAAGLNAAAHQRKGMRQRAIRARRSRTPVRPQTSAVTASAARAGPRSAGKWVGQPTPFFTTSPAATNGNAHAHESVYAKTTKEASGERLTALAIGSSLLVTPASEPAYVREWLSAAVVGAAGMHSVTVRLIAGDVAILIRLGG